MKRIIALLAASAAFSLFAIIGLVVCIIFAWHAVTGK